MCMGGPKAPDAPVPVPPAPTMPEERSGESTRDRDRRRRMAASGGEDGRSTILTSSRGVQDGAATAQKTLLGQ